MASMSTLRKKLKGCDKSVKSNVMNWTLAIARKQAEKDLKAVPEPLRRKLLKLMYCRDMVEVLTQQLKELKTYNISSLGLPLGIKATTPCIEAEDVKTARKLQSTVLGVRRGKLHVLHRCDNRMCVNAEHLFWGSATDNQRDASLKGRHARCSHGLKTPEEVMARKKQQLEKSIAELIERRDALTAELGCLARA